MNLQDKVVLITGGSDGIGAACAVEMKRCGAKLSIVDLKAPPQSLLAGGHLYTCGDIVDEKVRRLAFERTISRFGTIDVLINSAGIGLYASVQMSPIEVSRRMFDVNLFASLAFDQLVGPLFAAKRSGVIVNIGSIGGEVALPWAALYCASKSALHAATDSLRRELKHSGVRVITVVPGVVKTGFRNHVMAGTAPPNVQSITGMPPEDLALAIRKKITGRGSVLVKPWYGRLFSLADRLLPWLTDEYVDYCWSRTQRHAVAATDRLRTSQSG